MTTPLPAGWTKHFDAGSNMDYYVNHDTQITQWDDPRANSTPLPAGWESQLDPGTNTYFYIHAATQTTQWEDPRTQPLQVSLQISVLPPAV